MKLEQVIFHIPFPERIELAKQAVHVSKDRIGHLVAQPHFVSSGLGKLFIHRPKCLLRHRFNDGRGQFGQPVAFPDPRPPVARRFPVDMLSVIARHRGMIVGQVFQQTGLVKRDVFTEIAIQLPGHLVVANVTFAKVVLRPNLVHGQQTPFVHCRGSK